MSITILIVLLVVVSLLVWWVLRLVKLSDPIKYGKEFARAQLRSYREIKRNNPNMSKEDLYFNAAKCRPSYEDYDIKEVLKTAKEQAGEAKKELNFRIFVIHYVHYEYAKLGLDNVKEFGDYYFQLEEGVKSMIPEDL